MGIHERLNSARTPREMKNDRTRLIDIARVERQHQANGLREQDSNGAVAEGVEKLGSVYENTFVQLARGANHELVRRVAQLGGYGEEKKKNGVPVIKKSTSGLE